jgi:putative toxin of predicted polymorphic toxin system
MDQETGLLLLTNRYYDPGTGRFLTRDPLGSAGGMNLYGYVGNGPLAVADPSGLCPGDDDSLESDVQLYGQLGRQFLKSPDLQPGSKERVGYSGQLDTLPGIGQIKAGYQAWSGRDPIAGTDLSVGHRALFAAVAVAPALSKAEPSFATGRWFDHFVKHEAEFGGAVTTPVQYLCAARQLFGGGPEIVSFTRKTGDILFFNKATNEFGVLAKGGQIIRTYFIPRDGINYWLTQLAKG